MEKQNANANRKRKQAEIQRIQMLVRPHNSFDFYCIDLGVIAIACLRVQVERARARDPRIARYRNELKQQKDQAKASLDNLAIGFFIAVDRCVCLSGECRRQSKLRRKSEKHNASVN